VAKKLGLIEQTRQNWVKAAAAGTLNGVGATVVTPEQMEFSRLASRECATEAGERNPKEKRR